MRPQVTFQSVRAWDPLMLRWVHIMAHTGAGSGRVKFGDAFFKWLRDQMIMVEDYAYAGIDFTGDLDLPLPLGEQWGDIGKKQETLKMKKCFYIFYVLYFL